MMIPSVLRPTLFNIYAELEKLFNALHTSPLTIRPPIRVDAEHQAESKSETDVGCADDSSPVGASTRAGPPPTGRP